MDNKYVNKYTVSTFGVKEKLAVALGVVLAIVLYFMFFHVDKTPYGYAEIPDDVDAYMKTADNYSRFYGKGKMLIMYYDKRDKDNPYSKTFKDAIESAKRNQKISDLYEFRPFNVLKNNVVFDGKEGEKKIIGEKAVKKVCRSFCIVNPEKKALYFYFKPEQRDVQYLESNLEKLEFWGAKLD